MEKCLYYLPRSLIPVMQEQLLETFEAVTLIDEKYACPKLAN